MGCGRSTSTRESTSTKRLIRASKQVVDKPTFGYWNFRARAEPGRLLLHHLEIDFLDKRYGPGEGCSNWQEEKPNLGIVFPNLPYYKDGDVFHSESIPIMRSICRKYKPEYLGQNELE